MTWCFAGKSDSTGLGFLKQIENLEEYKSWIAQIVRNCPNEVKNIHYEFRGDEEEWAKIVYYHNSNLCKQNGVPIK